MKKVFFTLTSVLIILIILAWILVSRKEKGVTADLTIPMEELSKFESIINKFEPTNKPKLLILFSPGCDYCEDEFLSIDQNFEKLSGVQLILISPYKKAIVEDFIKKYKFCKSSETSVLIGKHATLDKIFGRYSFPTLFIINKDGKVLRKFNGLVNFDAVLKQIFEKH